MGTWGINIYQNDVSDDVRHDYKDMLKRGKTGPEVTKELIANNRGVALDPDDATDFWCALADTQWNLGRLEEEVKKVALILIDNEADKHKWDEKEYSKRKEILQKLKEKLLSPQPEEKKIAQYNIYKCEWKYGDVYAYPIEHESAKEIGIYGRYFLFHKIGETTVHPGHIAPVVRVKITEGDTLPTDEKAIDQLEYVQVGAVFYGNRFQPLGGERLAKEKELEKITNKYQCDEYGLLREYRVKLYNSSKRIIPKNLVYLGNFPDIKPPEKEFVPHSDSSMPLFMWKYKAESLIRYYKSYNLRQSKIYLKHHSKEEDTHSWMEYCRKMGW